MHDELYSELMNQKRKVDFNTYDFSIKELISLVTVDKVIDIAPEYQRHFRWDDVRQSSLIESFFLGLPIPSLFMATNGSEGNWELIDGVQRVSTIIHFAGSTEDQKIIGKNEPLQLQGLTKLTGFNGLTFDKMPIQLQLAFIMAIIKVISLTDKSDHDVRFDLFERLNRGGVTLSDQEIRSCVYRGQFNDFIKRMVTDPNFLGCLKLSVSQNDDGTKEELILRFFAYLNNYKKFTHSVVDFLNDYMEHASKQFDYRKEEEVFHSVFESLYKAFPNGIKKRGATPIILFEAITVGAALAYKHLGKINTIGISEWINDAKLTSMTTGGTNSAPKVTSRIEFCQKKFEG